MKTLNKIKERFNNNGYYVLFNFFSKKKLGKIKKKIYEVIKDEKNYLPIKDIAAYSKNSRSLKGPNGKLIKNLKKFDIKKGLRNIAKKSNSISIRDPLINIMELNDIVFDNRLIKVASTILDSPKIKLGYIKLGVFFDNQLPRNCINYFHTDDLSKKINKLNKSCKFSFTLSSNSKRKNEFGILPIKKNKLKFYKQYFKAEFLSSELQKKIVYPSLNLGDAVLFDPNNFFHIANKPKNNLRIIFYIEFFVPKTKFLSSNVKIKNKIFQNLDANKKKLCRHYQLIN